MATATVFAGPAHAAPLKEGDKAPDFTLKQQDGRDVTLSKEWAKGIVVLYFYPMDNTPGCTKEACAFRDLYNDFKNAGAEVLGISVDDAASHKKFQEKHKLPFTLLADTEKKVTKLYDVKNFIGKAKRVTFVIDTAGIIKKIYPDVNVGTHGQEVLAYVKSLQKK
ncbi:MAG: peroxiredoxin [Deltaproteobacteria bacterium]|nr:peroxiredoxin [Deltaproteobacteria bacterium]